MSTANFPSGFMNGVTIRGIPINLTNTGLVFWVGNATTLLRNQSQGSDQNKGDFNHPFATLNYASTQCVASRGDIIMVKAGHSEAITTTLTCAMATAGVAVVGLGYGSMRPKFTVGTSGANTNTISVTADNVSFTNCQFVANFLSTAACFTLTTAKQFTLQNCTITDTSSIKNFLNVVKSTGAANTIDGISITECTWVGLASTSTNSMLLSANDIDSLVFNRNRIQLARTVDAVPGITISAGVVTNAEIGDNCIISQQTATTGGSLISVGGSTSSGTVYRNYVGTLTSTADKIFTTTSGLWAFENRVAGAIGATGFVIPAVDS